MLEVLQPHVKRGLGCSQFARRLLRESLTISFPPGTKIFQFPGLPPPRLSGTVILLSQD